MIVGYVKERKDVNEPHILKIKVLFKYHKLRTIQTVLYSTSTSFCTSSSYELQQLIFLSMNIAEIICQ